MAYYIGIDIGGTNSEIGILNSEGEILKRTSIKTFSKLGAEKTFSRIWDTCKTLTSELFIAENEIVSIGMGIPGPVVDSSIVKIAANFSWGENFPAKELMEKISGKTVIVENDVRAIALGEFLFGAARNYKNSIVIPIGTGIAAGIIIDGKILRGATGSAGEFGHITVEDEGYECGCGLVGCLETYCSASGIVKEAKSKLKNNFNSELHSISDGDFNELESKHIFDMAKSGDILSQEIVDSFCKYMAKGIGTLLNILNPEAIIFTGGVSRAGSIILQGVEKHLHKYALRTTLENIKLDFGQLEEDGGVKGAAALAIINRRGGNYGF